MVMQPRRARSTQKAFIRALLCVLGILGGAVSSSAAVADYIGKPIGSVSLTLEDRETSDPALTQVIETTVGQPLSMAAIRESITHLFSLGRFEGVSVDAALVNGRVALRYELRPIHLVTSVRFVGVPAGVDEGALRRAISDRYGATPALGRAADIARLAQTLVVERGYLRAAVTPQPKVEPASDRASLVLTIQPNERTRIGDVRVVGQPSVPPEEFLKRLGLVRGAAFQRDRLAANIEKYIADRRDHGYYEARITPAVALADNDRVAIVSVTVNSGPHVRIVFAGDPLPSDRRDELVPIAREGSVDEDLLEDATHRIEEYFHAQGYRKATAPHTREERNGELLITFTVTRGALYRVASYDVSGNASMPIEEIGPALRLRVGQPFADSRLDADASAIETLYRRRGFSTVKAQAAFDPVGAPDAPGTVPVAVRIVVAEGPRTTVGTIEFVGNSAIDAASLQARIGLRVGGPYLPGQLAVDRDTIQLAYQDLGYQTVIVDAPAPRFSADQSQAAISFRIQEGTRILVDHVIIVGNVRTRTETIERELQVKAGDPYSLAAINESQRRLTALGLFRRARISEVRHGNETTRDLLVTIEEAPPTTIGYGAGVEGRRLAVRDANGVAEERFDIAPRALFEIGRRNLFGRNRSASVFTSVSRSVTNPLTEYRAVATFREPRLFDTPADAFVNGTLEQQHRSTFDFARRSFSANVERRFSGPYRMTGTYSLQRTSVFNLQVGDQEAPLIDRTFAQFLLSSFSGSLVRDTRDDPLDTHAGEYASVTAQLAGQAIGSEVGFVKSFFTAQLFRTLPHTRQVVFAGNARLGVAKGFTNVLPPGITTTATSFTIEGQLPASERFFAGGDTTVRGFDLDQLGVRHVPSRPTDTLDADGFAIGGNGLVIFNAELRVPVAGGFGVVGFVDTGNVFARAIDIALGELRSAIGGGIRYKSPVGPLRIDLGFKVNRQPGESRSAWFVTFGQAF